MRRPGYERRGDYLVPRDDLEDAREAFSERSRGSRARDRLSRAPIERDYDHWVRNQRGLDYPGVDTPRDSPRRSVLDEFWDHDTRHRAAGREVVVSPEERPEWAGSALLGDLAESSEPPEGYVGRALDALRL
jgi:phytoene dehydrogenase-like protein